MKSSTTEEKQRLVNTQKLISIVMIVLKEATVQTTERKVGSY